MKLLDPKLGAEWATNDSPAKPDQLSLVASIERASSAQQIRVKNRHLRLFRGGTVNRPHTHVSYRKHTVGHTQGRNFPVHFQFPLYFRLPFSSEIASGCRIPA